MSRQLRSDQPVRLDGRHAHAALPVHGAFISPVARVSTADPLPQRSQAASDNPWTPLHVPVGPVVDGSRVILRFMKELDHLIGPQLPAYVPFQQPRFASGDLVSLDAIISAKKARISLMKALATLGGSSMGFRGMTHIGSYADFANSM